MKNLSIITSVIISKPDLAFQFTVHLAGVERHDHLPSLMDDNFATFSPTDTHNISMERSKPSYQTQSQFKGLKGFLAWPALQLAKAVLQYYVWQSRRSRSRSLQQCLNSFQPFQPFQCCQHFLHLLAVFARFLDFLHFFAIFRPS